MKATKKIILITALVLLILPSMTHAVSWWPLVPCGTSVNPTLCNRCDLLKLLKNIIDFVLIGLMPPAAAILFVWGGFLILMGGANPGWITQGKSIFWNTAIGVAIILMSWLITNSIIRSLAADNIAPEWWKFQCSVTIPPPPPPVPTPLSITTTSLPNAIQGTVYAQYVQASGGTTPYTLSITTGSLPPGLSLSQVVGITGTPTTAGTYPFTVRVTDSSTPQQSATKQLSIVVGTTGTGVSITTASLPNGTVNQTYSTTVSATGGTAPYTWAITTGTLPPGLNGNPSTGVISGTPTTTGTSTFTVKVEDSSTPKKSATKQLSIVVGTTVANCGDFDLVCSNTSRSCPSMVRDTGVPQGQTSWAYLIPLAAHSIPGVNTNKLLEAIMRIETNGRIDKQSGSVPASCGLMQIQAGTANMYRNRCGVDHNITCDWLRGKDSELQQGETIETVARASICIASEYMIAAKNSSCYGGQIRDLAAGYNGGSGCDQDNPRGNALALSVSCSQQSTANPKNDLDCNNRPTLRYECLWSNASHTTCNTGFNETRDYAAKFNACYF